MNENKENLIKQVCKELNLTYKQLGELIGYSEGRLKLQNHANKLKKCEILSVFKTWADLCFLVYLLLCSQSYFYQ